MSGYQKAVKRLVDNFGTTCQYTKMTHGSYDVESGTVINTTRDYYIKLSKSSPRYRELDSPHLIGKEVAIFYMGHEVFKPSVGDLIKFQDIQFEVSEVIEQRGTIGVIAGYRLVATRG